MTRNILPLLHKSSMLYFQHDQVLIFDYVIVFDLAAESAKSHVILFSKSAIENICFLFLFFNKQKLKKDCIVAN